MSTGFYQVAHWTFSIFYLVNVQEASRILRRKKTTPKWVVRTLVAISQIIVFGFTLYINFVLNWTNWLIAICLMSLLSISLMMGSIIWLKLILGDQVKKNIPMMVAHVLVLCLELLIYVADFFYILGLTGDVENRDKESFQDLFYEYNLFIDFISLGFVLIKLFIAETLRRLAKRVNVSQS
jgi:hypothetical protein